MNKIVKNKSEIFIKDIKNAKFNISNIKLPFACLIVSSKKTTAKMKLNISNKLVKSKCRYVVCAGKDGDIWEDATDKSFLRFHNYKIPINYSFITAFLKDESPQEIIDFLILNTTFGKNHIHFKRFLILFIGSSAEEKSHYLDMINEVTKNEK